MVLVATEQPPNGGDTMKIIETGSNTTVIELADGSIVLFSYKTPVAAWRGDSMRYVKTEEFFSVTTSRHVNQWLRGEGKDPADVPTIKQSDLEMLGV